MIDLYQALLSGLSSLLDYLSGHVVQSLVPAFLVAGAIAAFLKKEAILKYFGPTASKWVAYPLASLSGTALAVCSCTILPLFGGIYRKGSGIGPATAFLYAGPAINILAIIYTAQVLGYDIGLARAVGAVISGVAIGLLMAAIFKKDEAKAASGPAPSFGEVSIEGDKPKWIIISFFALMVAILVVAASQLELALKMIILYVMTVALALILIYKFKKDEITEWGYETWDLVKKIMPILVGGAFLVGFIAYFLPPETFQPYLGDNSVPSVLLASLLGGILYMPTLLEVPIIGTTFGYTAGVMAGGPALALLLSGPTISIPSLIVLYRIMGLKKTVAYFLMVVMVSAIIGLVYGAVWG
mgnify:CR=1 FL=1